MCALAQQNIRLTLSYRFWTARFSVTFDRLSTPPAVPGGVLDSVTIPDLSEAEVRSLVCHFARGERLQEALSRVQNPWRQSSAGTASVTL